jgi:hypothetical protein
MYTSFKYLYHPKSKKMNFTNHFLLRLYQRKKLKVENLFKEIKGFVYHDGSKYCKDSLVINSKISKEEYPYCDYLYSKRLDMILVFERETKNIITVLDFDTSYYKGGYNISNN